MQKGQMNQPAISRWMECIEEWQLPNWKYVPTDKIEVLSADFEAGTATLARENQVVGIDTLLRHSVSLSEKYGEASTVSALTENK